MVAHVPNSFPRVSSTKRIALIGEAPGRHETEWKRCPNCGKEASWNDCFQCQCMMEPDPKPFVGPSGRLLGDVLSIARHTKAQCYLGNVSQYRPDDNRIESLDWTGDEIQSGMTQLREDLLVFKPNIVVLFGNVPLKAAKDPRTNHPLVPKAFRNKVSNWRGSLFIPEDGPFAGFKCLSAYHPAFVLRAYEESCVFAFDLKRAVEEASDPGLVLPKREITVFQNWLDCVQVLRRLQAQRQEIALDIEGGVSGMSCISFADDPCRAYVIPFFRKDHSRWWQPHEERYILRAMAELLENRGVPKCLQNGLYDRFVLHYAYGIRVFGNRNDTMLKAWELNSELEKGLDMLTSVYTREPYYKGDRKSQDDLTFFRYCGMDSCVTLEISRFLDGALHGASLEHYQLNIKLLNPLLAMEIEGIRYDTTMARARAYALQQQLFREQATLNALSGQRLSWANQQELSDSIRALMFTKKGDRLYKDYEEAHARVQALLEEKEPTLATIGEIETLLEVGLNVDSKTALQTYLYENLSLPVQYNTDRITGKKTVTTDYEALLKLSRHCLEENLTNHHRIIQTIIGIRALATRTQMLGISADRDGRIRCGYNLVGSDTGRITCYTSPTGSGYNLQTIPNYQIERDAPGGILGDRDLFLADPDHWFFQCDLKGSDGWTVAAYSAMLGDATMLEDYKAGVTPFERLTLKIMGIDIPRDRTELKALCKARINKDGWERFASKRVQHGGSYLEGGLTVSRNILKDSEGKMYLTPTECQKLLDYFFGLYPGIKRWQDWVARQLKLKPVLTAASGQHRRFFGRPDEIVTKAVAFEPQANTTYATNLAMHKLWTDPENRTTTEPMGRCLLRVKPLHQVHDALCGQFRKEDTTWAVGKIKSYFDNTLLIAGIPIVIPFDGGYGPSWGTLNEGKI